MLLVEKISSLSSDLLKGLREDLKKKYAKTNLSDPSIDWKRIESDAVNYVEEYLKKNLDLETIEYEKSQSKSAYPDLKLTLDNEFYAIDIKCNEMQKEPWFDIARLDTFEKARLKKYIEEWEIVIKYNSNNGTFVDCYMCLLREAIGKDSKDSNLLKYRPYDGKLRPKSWEDFENNISYWSDKNDFIKNLRKTQIHRWKKNIKEVLMPVIDNLEEKEKKEVKLDFQKYFI